MKRGAKTVDEETETEENEEDVSESEESAAASKQVQFLGIPIYKLSYRRLPRKCLKLSFLATNAAIFLVAISTVVIAIWMLTDSKLTLRLTAQKLFVTILLIVGMTSAGIALLGIFSFVKRKRSLLHMYIACHSLLLCAIFISSIMSSSFFERVTDRIRDDMKSTIVKYRALDWVTEAWDNTQQYLRCCGIKSHDDWAEYFMEIPQSCCTKTIDQCLHMTEDLAFKPGCLRSTYLMLKAHIDSVSVAALLVSLASAASLFLALGVKKRLMREYTQD